MSIIKRWFRTIRFAALIVPLIVPLILLCMLTAGFLAGYSLRVKGEMAAFAAGLVVGAMLTSFGIIFSLQWLAEAEKRRHEQVVRHLDEEVEMNKTARRSWLSGMVWRVGSDDQE